MIRLILVALLGTASIAGTCQKKDSIYFYNGQILIGEVQEATLGSISIDDVDLKIQHVKLYKIRRLRINKRFKIETLDKRIHIGFLQAVSRDGWIRILPDKDSAFSIPIVDIHQLVSLEKQFFKRLNGDLSAGFSYTKSSNIGQVNFSASVGFATRLFEYQLVASEIGSIDSGKLSRDNENLQLFVGYDLSSNWFLAGIGQYQRNLELSISRRYLEMLGAGNKLVVRDTWQLLAVTGFTFTQEKSTANAETIQFEIPLIFRFNFYKFHHPNIQISSSQTFYMSLSEQGRVRYDGNTSFSWELIRYFYLKISPYSNFDSRPPSGEHNKFDYGIVVSLSYKF